MKLARRTSLFFLAALAVVLIGFSASIHWIVRSHLYNQLHEITEAALDTLSVAVESGPEGLEWDAKQRRLAIDHPDGGSLSWVVFDERGRRVDGAEGSVAAFLQPRGFVINSEDMEESIWKGECWRITHRRLHSDNDQKSQGISAHGTGDEPSSMRYAELDIAVGTPLTYITRQLRTLVLTLAGLTLSIWLSAAIFGEWLCRNALAPLTHIAESMSTMSAPALEQRLPAMNSGDELENLTRAFNGLLDRLQFAFDEQRRFAAEASHQLRTPLTAMICHVDVCLRRDRGSDEYRQTLQTLLAQSTRLRRTVEMLLFLTRQGEEAIPPELDHIELNAWLRKHIASWQQHARYDDIQLELDGAMPLWIRVHELLLGEALDNLVDNAAKYSAAGTAIYVQTGRSDSVIKLAVRDEGFGIAENELSNVVQPFFRSDAARGRGIQGSGLGLSIVQSIIHAFDATLTIESRVDDGSTVTITFPAADARSASSSKFEQAFHVASIQN